MSNLRSAATELNSKTINIFKYGWGYAGKTMAMFMFNLIDLNNPVIDWKNIKPKPFKVETKENLLTDATYGNKATWQEVNVRDQVLVISSVCTTTNTMVVAGTGPLSYKRGQWFFNPQRGESYQLNTDLANATVGAVSVTLTFASETAVTNAVATNNLRMSGYSKPYGNNEGNSFTADQVVEMYNVFTGFNMALSLDQNELNQNSIFMGDAKSYIAQKTTEAARKMLVNSRRQYYSGVRGANSIGGTTAPTMGGLNYFLESVSGIAADNIGTGATGAKAGEIVINGSTYDEKRQSFQSALNKILISPLPNIKGSNKLMFLCTTSFMREIEEMYFPKLTNFDRLKVMDLEVETIKFANATITFIVDESLDDLYYTRTTGGAIDILKKGFIIPIDYCKTVIKANDVVTKDGYSVPALGMGKFFVLPQTAEEVLDTRLYSSASSIRGAISSGAYRRVSMGW